MAGRNRYQQSELPHRQPLRSGHPVFPANFGGLDGKGGGWLGDPLTTWDTGHALPVEARILPEQVNGAANPIYFDGYCEFDDLPSSKYHRAGDQAFGEVTSPFDDSIWGQDLGTHNPDSPVLRIR